jgi:hypothetical protein
MTSIPTGPERRRFQRSPSGLHTSFRVMAGPGGPQAGESVVDLSQAGTCVVLGSRVKPGAVLHLDLSHDLTGCHRQVVLRITHVRKYPGGHFAVGGPFDQELSLQEVQELL